MTKGNLYRYKARKLNNSIFEGEFIGEENGSLQFRAVRVVKDNTSLKLCNGF